MNIQNQSINGMNQGRDTTIEPAYMTNYLTKENNSSDIFVVESIVLVED